jgi:diguanylate cyclase (GGDEF)-like protein
MFGLAPDTPVSTFQEWLQYVVDDDRAGLRKALDLHLGGESPHFEHEYRVRHANTELKSVLCRGIAVRDETGRPVRMAGSQTDITEWRRVQETLAKAARHDPLTGLPNRTLFGELLQREMARTTRMPERRYAVLFIDLDGFKLVNDSLGHLIGDHFLIAIAQRLQSRLRPGDSLARLGGDEFAVLVADISGCDDVTIVAERMQKALADPFEVQGHEIYASASIGIVLADDQYKSVSDLLRDADTAMYRSKAAGRGGYELFDPTMHASAMNRLTLETDLRRAVERNEFVVFFQPIVELLTSEVCGFEALVRWKRPSGELASPAEFIAVAEETGLIVPMTTFVLSESARQIAAWQTMFGRPNMYVSVNISPKLFARPDLVDQVRGRDAANRDHARDAVPRAHRERSDEALGNRQSQFREAAAAARAAVSGRLRNRVFVAQLSAEIPRRRVEARSLVRRSFRYGRRLVNRDCHCHARSRARDRPDCRRCGNGTAGRTIAGPRMPARPGNALLQTAGRSGSREAPVGSGRERAGRCFINHDLFRYPTSCSGRIVRSGILRRRWLQRRRAAQSIAAARQASITRFARSPENPCAGAAGDHPLQAGR